MTPKRVYVFPVPGRAEVIERLKQIIEAAGCVVIGSELQISDFEKALEKCDVLVILICAETIDDKLISPAVKSANHKGKRIVGVWAPDSVENKVPASLHGYGSATIKLDPTAVASTICGEESVWVTPAGDARPKPKTPRHRGH